MRNILYFLKLRSNVVLSGDVDLAEREIKSFFTHTERVSDTSVIDKKLGLPDRYTSLHTRTVDCIGFIASGTKLSINGLVLNLNFTQEIWFDISHSDNFDNSILNENWVCLVKFDSKKFICALPLMACGELLSQAKLSSPQTSDIKNLTASLAGNKSNVKAPTSGGTSTQHVHSLHKYKAKFFPRLIRSFLVQYLSSLPKNEHGKLTLLDPFVGSGTALIEASLLGIDSVGVDIDKLSCAITQAKIDALTSSPCQIAENVKKLNKTYAEALTNSNIYKFPKSITKKFERWKAPIEQLEYEQTIAKWIDAIDKLIAPETKHLFEICLSDALTRKFVIRMMGTGVGRFALEIAKTSLDTLMASNFRMLINSTYVANALIEGYGLTLGEAKVYNGTAVDLPFESDSFSITITSPPYLPASSGREDYLVGKAISCTALNLMSDDEIEEAETNSVGSMKSIIEHKKGLPEAVYALHKWLANDDLREIKADPTLAYYVSLKKALEENYRVLMPDGIAIYVIGKESVFYTFKTREVLYKVECDKIFAEIAESCNFIIEEQVNVELDKKNKNARPRSLDSYYESVFILRKRK